MISVVTASVRSQRNGIGRPQFVLRTVQRIVPRYLYHLLRRPFRRTADMSGYTSSSRLWSRSRVDEAIADTMFDMLCVGYSEVTHLKAKPETGQMLRLIWDLVILLDNHLDRGGHPPRSLEEVLSISGAQEQVTLIRQHAELFNCATPVLTYLKQMFDSFYDDYIRLFRSGSEQLQLEPALRIAEMDSGALCSGLMVLIQLFNDHTLTEQAYEEFYWFGMAIKFLDDMVDLPEDLAHRVPNLLYGMLLANEQEMATYFEAFASGVRLNSRWWRSNCPATYDAFFDYLESYYTRISSHGLRLICDALLLRVALGRKFGT